MVNWINFLKYIANAVTVLRVILALITAGLIWCPGDNFLWLAFLFTVLVIWGDGLDGFLARKFKQTSEFGAMLDIAGDRVVEMTYFIAFSALHWISVWIPLLFLVRGTVVDTIRAQATRKGMTAFGEKTMMQSRLGKLLVSSNWSRSGYAISKALAFGLMIAGHISSLVTTPVPAIALFCVYFSCLFCVIRGLPVLIEGKRLLQI